MMKVGGKVKWALVDAGIGAGVVAVLIILLGEWIGAPLELTPFEWGAALGAGAGLGLLDHLMAKLYTLWVKTR